MKEQYTLEEWIGKLEEAGYSLEEGNAENKAKKKEYIMRLGRAHGDSDRGIDTPSKAAGQTDSEATHSGRKEVRTTDRAISNLEAAARLERAIRKLKNNPHFTLDEWMSMLEEAGYSLNELSPELLARYRDKAIAQRDATRDKYDGTLEPSGLAGVSGVRWSKDPNVPRDTTDSDGNQVISLRTGLPQAAIAAGDMRRKIKRDTGISNANSKLIQHQMKGWSQGIDTPKHLQYKGAETQYPFNAQANDRYRQYGLSLPTGRQMEEQYTLEEWIGKLEEAGYSLNELSPKKLFAASDIRRAQSDDYEKAGHLQTADILNLRGNRLGNHAFYRHNAQQPDLRVPSQPISNALSRNLGVPRMKESYTLAELMSMIQEAGASDDERAEIVKRLNSAMAAKGGTGSMKAVVDAAKQLAAHKKKVKGTQPTSEGASTMEEQYTLEEWMGMMEEAGYQLNELSPELLQRASDKRMAQADAAIDAANKGHFQDKKAMMQVADRLRDKQNKLYQAAGAAATRDARAQVAADKEKAVQGIGLSPAMRNQMGLGQAPKPTSPTTTPQPTSTATAPQAGTKPPLPLPGKTPSPTAGKPPLPPVPPRQPAPGTKPPLPPAPPRPPATGTKPPLPLPGRKPPLPDAPGARVAAESYTIEEWMSMLEEAGYSLEEGNAENKEKKNAVITQLGQDSLRTHTPRLALTMGRLHSRDRRRGPNDGLDGKINHRGQIGGRSPLDLPGNPHGYDESYTLEEWIGKLEEAGYDLDEGFMDTVRSVGRNVRDTAKGVGKMAQATAAAARGGDASSLIRGVGHDLKQAYNRPASTRKPGEFVSQGRVTPGAQQGSRIGGIKNVLRRIRSYGQDDTPLNTQDITQDARSGKLRQDIDSEIETDNRLGMTGPKYYKTSESVVAENKETKTCKCGNEFTPSFGEYHRCPACLSAQHDAAEKATGVQEAISENTVSRLQQLAGIKSLNG